MPPSLLMVLLLDLETIKEQMGGTEVAEFL